jgi:cell division inhibitor SulA/protein ImuA
MNAAASMQRTGAWRSRPAGGCGGSVATGYSDLDDILPARGWPQAALTEILVARQSVAAVRLVMPAVARLSHQDRWICWVAPPHKPYLPALLAAGVDPSRVLLVHPKARRDGLRAVEQSLRSGKCSAVLAWPAIDDSGVLNRLQFAARAGDALGFLFRPRQFARRPSPAALRVELDTHIDGNLSVSLLGRRVDRVAGPVTLDSTLSQGAMALHSQAVTASRCFHPRWQ